MRRSSERSSADSATGAFEGTNVDKARLEISFHPGYRRAAIALWAFALLTSHTAHASLHPVDLELSAAASITINSPFERTPPNGWVPLIIQIDNKGPADRAWTFEFQTTTGSVSSELGTWTCPVRGGEKRDFPILVPQPWLSGAQNYSFVQAMVSGPGVREPRVAFPREYHDRDDAGFFGMTTRLATENWSRLEAEITGGAAPGTRSGGEIAGAKFAIAELPPDWRSFSALSALVMHRDEWSEISEEQRQAILRWVFQGGRLLIGGAGNLGANFPVELTPQDSNRQRREAGFGFGFVDQIPFEDESALSATPEISSSHSRLPIAEVATILRSHLNQTPALASSSPDSSSSLVDSLGGLRSGGIVVGVIVIVIALMLGPVNILFLAPARKRARLFITVPIISLGGAALIALTIVLRDGFGGHGLRAVLIDLLPDRPEALVFQEQAAVTGFLVGRSFSISADATMVDTLQTSELGTPYRYRSRPAPEDLDRDGGRLSGNWFTSRAISTHHLRLFEPTRAAITVDTDANGRLAVISTCPSTLRELCVLDGQKRTWWAPEVPPGQRISLTPVDTKKSVAWARDVAVIGPSESLIRSFCTGAFSFHARSDRWDESIPVPTLDSIRWNGDRIFVTGVARHAALSTPRTTPSEK